MNRAKIVLILALFAAIIVGNAPILAAQETGEPETVSIWVEEIRVSSSEIFSDEEIAEVVQPYEGRHLTIADLNDVLDRLNQRYLEKGVVAARAVLPPQTVEEGVVHIALVEGRVGDVLVEGNQYTQAPFIVDRINIEPGDLVDVAQLESDLLFFNAVYDVHLVARLEPGDTFGTTNYIIEVVEPKRWSTEISYTNSNRKDSAANRLSLTVANRGLVGRSDPFTLTVISSEGATAGSASYVMPLGRAGGKLHLSFQRNRSEAITADLASIDVVSDSSGGAVGWSHPLVAQPGVNVRLAADYRWLKSKTSVLGTQLVDQFQRGMTYGITSELVSSERTLEIRHLVTTGTYQTKISKNNFAKYWGDFTRRWRWKEWYTLSSRINWQLKWGGVLPSSEHFALGGQGTVRGLPPGVGSGENGYAMSLEIRRPISQVLEVFAFIDHGGAFPDPDGIGSATSIGIGADFRLFKSFSGSLTYGLPLGLKSSDLGRGRLDIRASLGF